MIPTPKLDDRTYADIVAEALRLIPRYCPDWTNHNPSDPGITLLELTAWMTELILYRLNRVPEKSYLAFLDLIGVRLRSPKPEAGRAGIRLQAIREGLGFVWRSEVILGCMALDMFAVIFGGASALLPIYATDIPHVGARGYGILASSFEVGALVASAALIARRPIIRAGPALLVTVAAYGIATIAFGLSRWFPLLICAYAAAGMADQVSVVLRNTVIQLSAPDLLRGRVSAVNMIFIGASNQLGAAESGFVAALANATFSVVSGGLGCLVVVAIVAARLPRLRRYRIDEPLTGRG